MTPGAGPFLTPGACLADNPRGMFGRHTKYESFGPCGFGEENFFMFFLMTPGAAGAGPVWTPGAQ